MQRLSIIRNQLHQVQQKYKKLEIEILLDDQIGIINMNSPADLNSLSILMKAELVLAVKELDLNRDVKVIIILSKVEKAFCAGANIKDFIGVTYEKELLDYNFREMAQTFGDLRKPLISAVNGLALGGGLELALFSDIILCSEDAKFGLPELKLGLIPGINGTQRLAKIIGKTQAMQYILTSDTFNAQMAQKMGLVNTVVKKEQLREEAIKIAKRVSEKSLFTLMIAKEAIKQAEESGLSQGNKFESYVFRSLHNTQASKEGMKAFVEKRQPNFKDL